MKNGKWLFLLYLLCLAVGFVWSVQIYFDNWNRIMSDHDKFELYKYPVGVLFLGIIAYNFHKVFYEKE